MLFRKARFSRRCCSNASALPFLLTSCSTSSASSRRFARPSRSLIAARRASRLACPVPPTAALPVAEEAAAPLAAAIPSACACFPASSATAAAALLALAPRESAKGAALLRAAERGGCGGGTKRQVVGTTREPTLFCRSSLAGGGGGFGGTRASAPFAPGLSCPSVGGAVAGRLGQTQAVPEPPLSTLAAPPAAVLGGGLAAPAASSDAELAASDVVLAAGSGPALATGFGPAPVAPLPGQKMTTGPSGSATRSAAGSASSWSSSSSSGKGKKVLTGEANDAAAMSLSEEDTAAESTRVSGPWGEVSAQGPGPRSRVTDGAGRLRSAEPSAGECPGSGSGESAGKPGLAAPGLKDASSAVSPDKTDASAWSAASSASSAGEERGYPQEPASLAPPATTLAAPGLAAAAPLALLVELLEVPVWRASSFGEAVTSGCPEPGLLGAGGHLG
mmetsp:Transcript_48208/g.97331  ORF Transcript_48208/g.97331 Transcript_48208/m.97331 type:complete len:448 (+) Transcript_48208:139-1482(+)